MNFNPQTVFRKQPMVYLAIALIIGILLNKFLNISLFPSSVPIILIILSKLKNSILLLLVLTIILGFSISVNKNYNFEESLSGLQQFSDKQVDFSAIIIEENNFSNGQRYILENIQLKSEQENLNKNFRYLVYTKNQITDNVFIGDTLSGCGKW